MSIYACKFYVTFRCNSKCVYCNIWWDEKYKVVKELPLDEAKSVIDELYQIGVRYIDFTGGEPSLYPEIEKLLAYTKSKGITTEFTTNCLSVEKKILGLLPYIDNLNISLDSLRKDRYSAARGVDGLDKTIHIIKKVVEYGKTPKIISVISEENIDEIGDLLKFAQENKVNIYFSPLFSYFDEMSNVQAGYNTDKLKELFYEPYGIIYMHFMRFFETADSEKYPECSSNHKIITVNPQGNIMVPCYHYYEQNIECGGKVTEGIQTDTFKYFQENCGKLKDCKGCTTIPYLGMSFSYSLNRTFLLQAFSEEYMRIKHLFLNPNHTDIQLDGKKLLNDYLVFEKMVDSIPEEKMNKGTFYDVQKVQGKLTSQIHRQSVTLGQYLVENLQEDCWKIKHTPHTIIRYFYNEIFVQLQRAYQNNKLSRERLMDLYAGFPEFHLSVWKFMIHRDYRVSYSYEESRDCEVLSRYLQELIAVVELLDNPKRIHSVISMISLILDISHDEPKDLMELTTEEQLLVIQYFIEQKNVLKVLRFKDKVATTLAPVFIQCEIPRVDLIHSEMSMERMLGNSESLLLLMEQFKKDKTAIYYVLENEKFLSENYIYQLIETIKSAFSKEEIDDIIYHIYKYEYYVTYNRVISVNSNDSRIC